MELQVLLSIASPVLLGTGLPKGILGSEQTTASIMRTASYCSLGGLSDYNITSCTVRIKEGRRVCVKYLDEPGRVDVYEVESYDYSGVGEDWMTKSLKRRRCEARLHQLQQQRRRGTCMQQQGCPHQKCDAVFVFDYQLALDVKRLNANPERKLALLRSLK